MMSTCCSKHVEAWNKHTEKECIKLVINQNYVEMHGQQNIKCKKCHNSVNKRDLWSTASVKAPSNPVEVQTKRLLHITEDTAWNLAQFWVCVNYIHRSRPAVNLMLDICKATPYFTEIRLSYYDGRVSHRLLTAKKTVSIPDHSMWDLWSAM